VNLKKKPLNKRRPSITDPIPSKGPAKKHTPISFDHNISPELKKELKELREFKKAALSKKKAVKKKTVVVVKDRAKKKKELENEVRQRAIDKARAAKKKAKKKAKK
jgi:hypothetical protein